KRVPKTERLRRFSRSRRSSIQSRQRTRRTRHRAQYPQTDCEPLMQRALSEGFYIDVERGILGIILDVEIEIRTEVVSAMTRTIRVMGWERQQPRDHDHHGSGYRKKPGRRSPRFWRASIAI